MESKEIKGILIPYGWSTDGRPTRLKLAATNEINYQLVLTEKEFSILSPFIGSEVILKIGLPETISEKLFSAKFLRLISTVKEGG